MKQLLSLWNSFPKKGKNKRSVLSRLAIFVCLLASAQAGWAADEAWNSFSSTDVKDGITGTDCSISFSNCTQSSKRVKFPTNASLTISSTTKNIASVVITWRNSSNQYPTAASDIVASIAPTTPELSGQTMTWTASGTSVTSVTFSRPENPTNTNEFQIVSIAVTYSSSAPATTPEVRLSATNTIGTATDGFTDVNIARSVEFTPTMYTDNTLTTTISSDYFDYTYTLSNVPGYPNASSISGNTLSVGKTTGRVYVTVTATPKAAYASTYNECNTTIGFNIISSYGDGTSKDVFTIDNFAIAATANGLNASNNNLDRTLKGFEFTFTGGEGVKYNNGSTVLLRRSGSSYGHIGILESNTGKCTIEKAIITYSSNQDFYLKTNANESVDEVTYLPSTGGSNATVEINLHRSFAIFEVSTLNDNGASINITSIELRYDKGSLDQTLVTPTISYDFDDKTMSLNETGRYIPTTTPKNLKVTYTSSNTSVATVVSDNSTDNATVSALALGTSTMTAAFAGNTYLNAATSDSYTLYVKDQLTAFELNANDIYYYSGSTGTFVNNTTFDYNADYTTLRVKAVIEPDFNSLTNPSFSVTSSDATVINTASATAYKAADQRMYFDGMTVLKPGTATLTFTFNGSDNYTGPKSFTATFNVNAGITYETVSNGTLSGATSALPGAAVSVTATPNTGYEFGSLTIKKASDDSDVTSSCNVSGTSFTMPDYPVKVSGTFNAATTAAAPYITFANMVSGASYNGPVVDGNTQTYTIINPQNKDQKVYVTAKAGTYVCIKHGADLSALTDPSTSNKDKYIDATSQSNDQNSGNAFSVSKGKTVYYIKAIAYTDSKGSNPSDVKLFVFNTRSSAITVSAPTITADGTTYTGTGKSVTIKTTETNNSPVTYYKVGATAETDAATIVSSGTAISGTSQTITATQPSSESDIVVSVVTKNSNNEYSEIVTATYTYAGAKTWSLSTPNITIQEGQRGYFHPVITDLQGNDIFEDYNVSDYFDFTYSYTNTIGNGGDIDVSNVASGMSTTVSGFNGVSADGGIITKREYENDTYKATYVGQKATVTITATRNATALPGGINLDGTTKTGTATATIIEYTKGYAFKLYWDADLTNEITDSYYTEDKTGSNDIDADFGNFPNGRVIYAAPNTATDELWFTYNTTSGTAMSRPTKMVYGKHLYQYRRGIPIQVTGTSGTIYVSLQPFYDSGTKDSKDNVIYNSRGSIMNLRFNVVDHERPANLTYEPSTAGTNLSTSISVAAVGTAGNTPKNQVYAKFTGKYTTDDGTTGSRTNYTIEGLVNEENVIYGEEQAAVFSTEVNKRIIEGVQYQWYDAVSTTKTNGSDVTYPAGFYVSGINENNYMYRFASKLTLSDNLFNVSIDNKTAANYADFDEPTVTVSYYNKDKDADVNITDLTYNRGSEDPVPTEGERITYSVLNHNGSEVSVNASTGEITIGNKSGYATITVSYPGGYTATVNGRPSYTAASSTTYTIYIVNTDEQVPTITPTSRSFVDEQDVTITAPSEWNALYMIQEYNNNDKYNPTFDDAVTYVSSGDNKNCFLLEAGKSVTVTITDSRKVRAFAYDPSATEFNTPGSAGNTSKEVSETYTVMEPLAPPTLDPWGDPHYRTTATLAITAIPPAAGVFVYFTTDGSEPTLESEEYDGNKKINISGASTTVKAIAYDPTTGRISAVTTGVYLYTGSVTAPKFQVTGTGAGTYSEGTVTVDKNSIIALVSSDGGNIYYTLDGTTPTSTDAKLYDATFKLVKSVTGKAIVVKDDAISPVTTVTFVLQNEDDIKELWEAVSVTTPKGKMPADDRYVSIANKESKSGNSSTKAVKYMTATFGGMNATGWSNTTIGEKTQGTPLDGVGEYSIRNSSDAADELGNEVINNGSTVHENTFKLPAQGDIVRFEPERDGTLSIWLLQQGGLHYNSDAKFCPGFIRLRPVYMFDERGASLPATSIQSAARLSSNWDDLDVSETEVSTGIYGNWIAKGGSQNGETNKFYTPQQSENIYNMYKNHLTTANISTGEAITPFELTDATVKGYTGIDGHGYVMPSGGFVKYTFSVKGGKSYYFFGYRTKLGIRGFQFTAPVETVAKTATVADETSDIISDIKSSGSVNADEICNITYQRKFTNGKWAGVVFPFSVSFAQMKKVFGDMVDVIHFESDDEHNINFRRHWYPMIVAGTPVLIKPAKEMGTSVTFEGVRIDSIVDKADKKVTEITGTNYKMTGTFTPSTIKNGDYYISGGNLAYRKSGDINTNACRSWLTPNNDSNAKEGLGVGTTDAFAEEGWDVLGNPQPKVVEDEGQDDTTPIVYVDGVQEDGIFGTDNPTNIYSINGQLVRSNATSTQGLAKGIYIANGKKFIVK